MKKVYFVLFLLINASFVALSSAKSGGSDQPVHCRKRLLKKIEYCKIQASNHSQVSSFDQTNNKTIVFKQIKRRYPKKVDLVKSQGESWPDDFGYHPKKTYRVK